MLKDLERIKWYLWHGNVFRALNELQSLEMDLDAAAFESKDENARKLLKGVEDLHTYVERNQEFVPNYGGTLSQRGKDRFRFRRVGNQSSREQTDGEETTDGMEPAWSTSSPADTNSGADEEWENTFRRWYPDFRPQGQAEESGVTPRNLPLSNSANIQTWT